MTSPPYTNRLIREKSPYLLQHAHNPVDWFPWGSEAFELAKAEDKPIFLSIGYSTCHWCHVMEEESFADPETAHLLNEVFVNIKIDREERPEVDNLYMDLSQAIMATAGGWPLNVILTPDLKPFLAVTYLPRESVRGLMGLKEFTAHVRELWHGEEKEELILQAERLVELFHKGFQVAGDELPAEQVIGAVVQLFYEIADPVYGGIKGEPKFPLGYQLQFLLEFARLHKESRALFYAELTLEKMEQGGVYDHLGGGFSRYSVDERWQVPHFEKMLYDNAILARTYLDGWKYTGKEKYKSVSKATLDYVLREMTDPLGGFYSAEDADTEGREGRYYTWTPSEVEEALEPEDAALFCQYYTVLPAGEVDGRSVLYVEVPAEEFAEDLAVPLDLFLAKMAQARKTLLEKRQKREHPFKDDKVLSGWNGLMIDALAKAGGLWGERRYLNGAKQSAEFIQKFLWKEGRLLRRYRDKDARFSACLEEYAFLIKGLLTLFEEGEGTNFLEWALEMAALVSTEFKEEDGAFYQTDGKEPLLVRRCDFYDGAEPSGNGVHAENLLRLYQLTQDARYLKEAEDIFKAAKLFIETYPPGACYHLLALQRYFDKKAPLVVIALDEKRTLEAEIRAALSHRFLPHMEVIWKKSDDALLERLLPHLKEKKPLDGQTAVYICTQEACSAPLVQSSDILQAIERL